jgi:predicted CoA-substrate-specific enzyme activase
VRYGGIDIGSRYIKYVVLEDTELSGVYKLETGYDPLGTCRDLMDKTRPDRILATGYGRHLLQTHHAVETVTEIRAVARGARAVFSACRTIIDIGGQDTKVVQLDENGVVAHFEMNDRCAAGTGRFLEIMAKTLGFDLTAFGDHCLGNGDNLTISSLCTVFAESEVISLIARGAKREAIAMAIHQSIANRVVSLAKRVGVKDAVVFAGGCARNRCLQSIFEKKLQQPILVAENPDILSAYGAALMARR